MNKHHNLLISAYSHVEVDNSKVVPLEVDSVDFRCGLLKLADFYWSNHVLLQLFR